MHGHEHRAPPLAVGEPRHADRLALGGLDAREGALGDLQRLGVGRVKFDIGLGGVAAEFRREAGAGHRVPVVPHAPGVEGHRIGARGRLRGPSGRDRLHAGASVWGLEAAVGEEARRAARRGDRPLHRLQGVIAVERGPGQRPEVQHPVRVLVGGQARPFAEHLGRRMPAEGVAEAHRLADVRHDPPVGARLAGRREQRALAADAALGVCDRAVLLAPGQRRQLHVGELHRVVVGHAVGDDDERAGLERVAHAAGVRQADRGVGGHDPQRLHLAVRDGVEQFDGLQARARRDPRAAPEALDAGAGRVVEVHVTRERCGHAAGLAAAHGVGLAGDRERAGARLADAAGGQVGVEDRRALGDPLGRLVGAHGEQADRPRRLGEQAEEGLQNGGRDSAIGGDGVNRLVRLGEFGLDLRKPADVGGDVAPVDGAAADEVGQQAVPEPHVRLRRERQVQVGALGRVRAPGVDDDMALAAGARGLHAAEEHRMGPGGVVSGEDNEVGEVQVLVAAGHQVGAERQLVGHHRRGHAEPRIGVDVP